jgi:diguanylate cyclase (GGDEF)-like protein
VASSVMGLAIIGMHYSGMHAAKFPEGSVCLAAETGVSHDGLAVLVFVVSLSILTIVLLATMFDARLESRTAKLAESLAQANQELKQMVLHDYLTQLPNRSLLEDRINQAIHKAARSRGHFALMFIDLDGFKSINDTLGHYVGDVMLIEVAKRLSGAIRGEDTVARLGGDEFVVLADLNNPEDAIPVAAKLVDAIAEVVMIEGSELRVSASIGIAIYPEDGCEQNTLMVNADAAMYYTKRSGRNGYNFYEASMNANARNLLQLLRDLRQAIEEDEFQLYYQPKFDAMNGRIIGAEALLRWHHPERGLIGPDEFIDVAERSGLIVAIGEWVINEACRQIKAWHDIGNKHWKVAINLTSVQFLHEDLAQLIQRTLTHYGLTGSAIMLEITESTALKDKVASKTILDAIAALGVDVSIDDFGTGYLSLLHLKQLHTTELKIDRGLIHNICQGGDDDAIVSAIVALGRAMNLRTVAEGVETVMQKEFLSSIGCDVLQGYLMGKPMPAEQFIKLNMLPHPHVVPIVATAYSANK